MKLLTACLAFALTAASWAQEAETPVPETLAPAEAPEVPDAETPSVPETPWALSGPDIGVRATVLIPVFDSYLSFLPGPGIGAEAAWRSPDRAWRVTGALDTNALGYGGQTFVLTLARAGLRYDAFFGPTAFMSFGIDAGGAVATRQDITLVDTRATAGFGTSIAFFLGPQVTFRTELRYLEVFGVLHAVTASAGFEIQGN